MKKNNDMEYGWQYIRTGEWAILFFPGSITELTSTQTISKDQILPNQPMTSS